MLGWRSTDHAAADLTVAHLTVGQDGDHVALVFSGRLNAAGAGELWHAAIRAASGARGQPARCDLAAVEALDMAGAALLLAVERAHGAPVELTGANAHITALLALARRALAEAVTPAVAVQRQTQALTEGPSHTRERIGDRPRDQTRDRLAGDRPGDRTRSTSGSLSSGRRRGGRSSRCWPPP